MYQCTNSSRNSTSGAKSVGVDVIIEHPCLLGSRRLNRAPQPEGLVDVVVEPGSDYSVTVARASIREQGLRDTFLACALSAFSMVQVNETPNQIG